MKFYLGLKKDAERRMREGDYEKALSILNKIIDEMGSHNPFFWYLRGKCHSSLGAGHLHNAREDLITCHRKLTKIHNENALLMKFKADYIAAICEVQHGCDLKRAEYYLLQFLEIENKFEKYFINRELPNYKEMIKNAKSYLQ